MHKIEWDSENAIRMYQLAADYGSGAAQPKSRYDQPDRDVRVMVYKSNLEVFSQWGYVNNLGEDVSLGNKREQLDATRVYREESSANDLPTATDATAISVEEDDCMLVGHRLLEEGYHPAILNLADAYHACGGYNAGSRAQEESLCRISTLSPCLYQYFSKQWANKTSVTPRPTSGYPMHIRFGGIYSRVTVFRHGAQKGFAFMDKPYEIGIVSVAALNLNRIKYDKNGKPSNKFVSNYEYYAPNDDHLTEEGLSIMRDKIRTIFRITLLQGHDSLVGGAMGCGAFKQNPLTIARLFDEVLHEKEFEGKLRRVVFAILGKPNYEAFASVLNKTH